MQAASKAMKSGVQFNTPARYQGVQKSLLLVMQVWDQVQWAQACYVKKSKKQD